jgi:hypothetical protein
MKLNARALAITCSLVWAGCVLLMAVLHGIWPAFGVTFLNLIASIYPGFHPGLLREVAVGTPYALLDGAVGGWLVGWLYNKVAAAAPAA